MRFVSPMILTVRGPHSTWLIITLLAGLAAGCRLAPPVVGLRPVYPPVRYGFSRFRFEPAPEDLRTLPVRIDSLQPVMRWRPLQDTSERRSGKEVGLPQIQHLGYDLRIWRDDDGNPSSLVYSREALTDSCHQLETPLQPDTTYCWSVRARFELNGEVRLTSWSFSEWPWSPADAAAYHAATPRGLNQIPPKNYYRFETP